MYTVLVLLSLVYAVMPGHVPTQLGLLNFDNVCKCMLGFPALVSFIILTIFCSRISCFHAYNGYGCYCGRGGSGTPIDGVDTCCMHHDHCYDAALESGACSSTFFGQYLNLYGWDCVNGRAVCRPTTDPCKAALCKCDVECVKCWSKQPRPKYIIGGKPKCPK